MWRVDVTPGAREAIAQLDGGLREELIEWVARMAEEPAVYLRRSRTPEPEGLWVLEYDSSLSPGLCVQIVLDPWDPGDKRLRMLQIRLVDRAE